ncbi:MAG: phosphotransferase [Rhizomicrobium sp.]
MGDAAFDAVPPARREAVAAALADTFAAAPIRAAALSGGASGALVFRIEAGGRPYLLRAEGPHSPLRNPHQYASMRIASEAAIAPRILHLDAAAGIVITDFIEQRPLSDHPGGRRGLVEGLAALLRRLQATPIFPAFSDYADLVARLFAHVRRTELFADGLLDPHAARLETLQASHPADPAQAVSAHNDVNPRNVLFDGERLWLIDWESAYRNDPLVDVAIALDNFAATPELEGVLLAAWHGCAPDEALRERLAAVRALTRLYYAGVLLSASATLPRTHPDTDLAAPSAAEFLAAIRSGRLKAGTPDSVHAAGKVYLASFLSGAAVPALDAI